MMYIIYVYISLHIYVEKNIYEIYVFSNFSTTICHFYDEKNDNLKKACLNNFISVLQCGHTAWL